jgi:hypothetical protein
MSQYDLDPKSLPFELISKGGPSDDELERSGQAIVTMIEKAAQAAKSRSDNAHNVAQKLSSDLGLAEKRLRELETEISRYRDRAARAMHESANSPPRFQALSPRGSGPRSLAVFRHLPWQGRQGNSLR